MTIPKKINQAAGATNTANHPSKGSTTEQGKSNTSSRPSPQDVLAKGLGPLAAPLGRLTSKSAVPKERMTKAEANRQNALKSTGPKTPRGKSYSRNNAVKHGIYSKELLVSEADTPEFEEMRVGLEAQLKPSTVLRWIAFDYVVVCNWRVKLASRLEQRQFALQLQDEQPENPQGDLPDMDTGIDGWYASSRVDLRAGIRVLEHAMKEFEANGYFREETKTFLRRGFGADFVRLLEEWRPMSKDAALLANHLVSHRNAFPHIPHTDVESSSTVGETTKVVLDPMQCQQMVGKLLEERRNYLQDLLIITGQNTLERKRDTAHGSEFNPRFLADANRELRRALNWYLYLKKKKL